jgi:hypothetical protein
MKKWKISITVQHAGETKQAWGTYDGIEGYHYTFLERAAKAFTKEELLKEFTNRLDRSKTAYLIEEVNESTL